MLMDHSTFDSELKTTQVEKNKKNNKHKCKFVLCGSEIYEPFNLEMCYLIVLPINK